MSAQLVGIYIHPETGNVGIGAAVPLQKLHVGGNAVVAGHVLPSANVAYDLGSASMRWRDLYLSGTTIDLGGTAISRDTTTGGLKVTDPTTGGAPLDLTVKNLIASNVQVIGDYVTLNTVTSNTEQVVVTNAGTGPALKVTQTGSEAIAEFYDDGGVLALKVADGGNVGIGTTTPLQALHVQGAVQAHTQFLGQQSNTVTAPSFSWAGDTNTGLYLPALDQIGVVTAGAERMRVAANGFVGIGTNNPTSTLNVYGGNINLTNASNRCILQLTQLNTSSTDNADVRLSTYDSGTSSYTITTQLRAETNGDTVLASNKSYGDILFQNPNGVSRMIITPSGNVGIGVTPTVSLEVNGVIKTSVPYIRGYFVRLSTGRIPLVSSEANRIVVSNSSRLYAPINGRYIVSFNSIVTSTGTGVSTGRLDINIVLNENTYIVNTLSEDNGTGFHYRSAVVALSMTTSDYISFDAGSGAVIYSGSETFDPWRTFSMIYIG